MIYSSEIIAPSIFLYKDIIKFPDKIINLSIQDASNWIIKNQDAANWKFGDIILGYDEYPINLSFAVDEQLLILAKKLFDCVLDYASKNITNFNSFDSCIIRKYSSSPTFLEVESPDIDNPLRKIVAILFLNNLENGGEVTFKNFNLTIKPRAGEIIIFPASFSYAFKINRPRDENNHIVVSYFV